MNKIEFLAASLPYGLMFFYKGSDGDFKGDTLKDDYNQLETLSIIGSSGYCQDEKGNEIDDQFKPVIRHIDTLDKECVQADYNDGKPFIPMYELLKTQGFSVGCMSKWEFIYHPKNKSAVATNGDWMLRYMGEEDSFFLNGLKDWNKKHQKSRKQLTMFQLILKWHFWPDMPDGEEVIYFSAEFKAFI